MKCTKTELISKLENGNFIPHEKVNTTTLENIFYSITKNSPTLEKYNLFFMRLFYLIKKVAPEILSFDNIRQRLEFTGVSPLHTLTTIKPSVIPAEIFTPEIIDLQDKYGNTMAHLYNIDRLDRFSDQWKFIGSTVLCTKNNEGETPLHHLQTHRKFVKFLNEIPTKHIEIKDLLVENEEFQTCIEHEFLDSQPTILEISISRWIQLAHKDETQLALLSRHVENQIDNQAADEFRNTLNIAIEIIQKAKAQANKIKVALKGLDTKTK